jgi:membrane protease YdiL (CAAX protease family)
MPADMESVLSTQHRKHHPEHESQISFIVRSWFDALFRPKIRLENKFPWGLKQFTKIYAVAAVYYVVASIVPLLLIFGGIWVALQIWPEQTLPYVADDDAHPNNIVMLVAMLTSFVTGFGAELIYINSELRKSGSGLLQVIGLNLNTLNGSWWEAFKRSAMALAIALGVQNLMDYLPLPHPEQATADLASHLSGASLVSFGVLAAILAPLFEEIIFRGCVFNAFRNIFREGRISTLLRGNHRVADYLAIVLSAAIFAAAHMDLSAFAQLFVLGMIMAELYRRTGSLICPIMLHAMNNLVATLLIAAK